MDMKTPSESSTIELHIEELVLSGFAANDRFQIGAAIEQELARLIMQQGMHGLRPTPANLDRLDAGIFRLSANAKPQAVGQQVAQRIYRQLSPVESRRKVDVSSPLQAASPQDQTIFQRAGDRTHV